jgi:hypothetical protein
MTLDDLLQAMTPFLSLREYERFIYRLQPHHKHIPPDIKHHRIPAPGLSFAAPNLVFLIGEVETTLLES